MFSRLTLIFRLRYLLFAQLAINTISASYHLRNSNSLHNCNIYVCISNGKDITRFTFLGLFSFHRAKYQIIIKSWPHDLDNPIQMMGDSGKHGCLPTLHTINIICICSPCTDSSNEDMLVTLLECQRSSTVTLQYQDILVSTN